MTEGNGKARALIVGGGAIGSVLAASLWRAGVPVEVLTKPAEAAEAAARDGFIVGGVGFDGDVTMTPKFTADAAELTDAPDCIFLATKAIHVAGALDELGPKLESASAVIVMQNGFCEEEVAQVVGADRIVSCTVRWGATLHGPTRSERTSAGGFTIGLLDGRVDGEMLETVVRMLETCAPVEITDNVLGMRHAKLVLNACFTTLGAVSGLRLRQILGKPAGRKMFVRVATEGVAVFRSMGVRLPKVDGLDLCWLCVPEGKKWRNMRRLRARVVLMALSVLRGGILSSSLQSLDRGEKTEIDYLNGYIVKKAVEAGLRVPVNELLVQRVKEIEAGEREVGPKNLILPKVRTSA